MEQWLPLLSEFGFPVMVTLYLLHRIEKKLDTVNESIQELVQHVHQPALYQLQEQKRMG